MGMEQLSEEAQLPVEDELQSRISSVLQSPPHVRENFSEPAECFRGKIGNKEIMEMLVSMKKEMEEREEVGTTTKNKRRISKGRLQKKRTKMGIAS